VLPDGVHVVQDLGSFALDILPIILGIILLVGVMLWFLAYIARYFEYLKMQESRYLDRGTLQFIQRVLMWVWVALVFLSILVIAQFKSPELRDVLVNIILRVPALFFVVFVMFTAAVIVRVMHRFASYLLGELRAKPSGVAPPKTLTTAELVIKYLVYLIAVAVAFVGGTEALPANDQWAKDWVHKHLYEQPDPRPYFGFLVALLIVFVAVRLVDSVFEDLKKRNTKFSAHALGQFKSLAKSVVYFVSGVVITLLLVDVFLGPERLMIFIVVLVVVIIIATLIAWDTFENALAGISIMVSSPFDVGDRVKVGDDFVCDIVSMNLTHTQARTLKGELANLPNRRLLRETILNFSRSDVYAMFVDVGVGFEVPHEKVRGLLLEAAKRTEGIVDIPAPEVYGKEVRGNTIDYQLLAYTKDPARMKQTKSDLIYYMQDLFHQNGIRALFSRT